MKTPFEGPDPGTAAQRPIEYFLLVVLAGIWGSSYIVIKVAVAWIPPVTLMAVRALIGTALLLALLYARGDRLPQDRRTWRMLLVQAVLGSAGAWTLLAWGQQYIDSSLAGVLNSTSPIWVFFITLLVTRHEAVTALKLLGALCGLAGVAIMVGWNPENPGRYDVLAVLAAVGGAILYAGAAVWGTRFGGVSVTAVSAGSLLWTCALLVPLSLLEAPWTLRPTTEAWAGALYLGVVCTAAATLLYFRLMRTLGSFGVASQSYLRAGWSVLLGVALLGESLTPQVLIGLAATVLAVVALNVRPAAR